MPYYLAEIRFNKNKSKKSEKKEKKRKRLISSLVTLTLISLLISAPVMLFSVVAIASEPSLPSILNDLGFTNIVLTDTETFSPGMYNITLYAEFAGYNAENELSYYTVETGDFQMIFTGPEGATGTLGGYVDPPISKYFTIDTQFGLSLLAPEHRYFTEYELNPDYPEQHAQVYRNLDSPDMFLVGFENYFGGCYRDYNDMVFSLVPLCPLEIVSVMRSPETPNYDQSVTTAAQVIRGGADIESVILSYQIDSASWINVTMSLEDGLYVADILTQPYNTTVNYKVYAFDTAGNSDVSELFSYVVGDFVPPLISNVIHVPDSPDPKEIVTVSAKVIEPADASGVKNVTLWYTATGTWSFIDMAMQDGLWTANIPGQSGGVYVKFFVEAFDNEANNAKTSTFGYMIVLPNHSPIPVLIYSPSIVYTGVVIDFDASASYDPDGSIVSYHWDFGDGNTTSEATVSHSYVDDGEYSVTLRIVDNEDAVGSKVAIQVVKNRPPIAALTESATILDKEEIVTFDASLSYDLDGTIVKYFWNFGDKTTASGVSVSHSYSETGAYTVTLTVTDDDGATDTIFATKIVGNKSPVAIFTESAETVHIDEIITFNATESHDPDGSIVTYSWDFGDGNTATGVTVSHAYSDNGFYSVTLTVTDNDGATDSAHATKIVMNRPPVASFTETVEVVDIEETISFDASDSNDPDGSIVDYSWDFGDGTKGTGVSVQHAYSQDGTYTVTLTVTDNDGAANTAKATKTVLKTIPNQSPIASFTESAETVSSGESIHFDASGSYDPDGTIVSYSWDFGDGNTATGVEVDHAYEDDGVYTVTLTVIDNDDATGSATTTKNVLNRPPIVSFTESAHTVSSSENIHFDGSESHDPDGTIVNYLWDFGDGNTAIGVTSDHAYSEDGNYTVTLTVTDDDGASASLVATKIVETETEIETALPLAVLSVIGLGVTALTATLLYALFIRRKKKKKTEENT
jgi:PKD repeat protein